MRGWSLRTWLLIVSIAFAAVVVGGIALVSYVIVSGGMSFVATDRTTTRGETAKGLIDREYYEAYRQSLQEGLTGSAATRRAVELMKQELDQRPAQAVLNRSDIALFGPDLQPLYSPEGSQGIGDTAIRKLALEKRRTLRSVVREPNTWSGLFGPAQLAVNAVHVPINLPGLGTGVLDVAYRPTIEEAVIDSVRLPMLTLAIMSTLLMVLLIQASMQWILRLIDTLRRAADSIDAGQLDARMPDMGTNEVGDLARSINRLLERLQRRSAAQVRFVADASHELATPVAGIRGYINILRAWGAEDPVVSREAVDAIDRESNRMVRLTGDLLSLLHTEQGLVLKQEVFDANVIVRQRLAAIASKWLEKDLEFEGPEEEEESLLLRSDPDRFEDVVSTLIDNAAKYTPSGGSVRVSTKALRDTVIVRVSDTGVGIPAEDLQHVFDRFYRSDASRSGGEGGFGLGLSIAKSIVDGVGGNITVESDLGQGTTFSLVWPRGRV
jgi:two-component system, OmpR family, sensor kinase